MEMERGAPASPNTGLLETQAAEMTVPTRMRSLSHKPKGGFCFIAVIFTAISVIYGVYVGVILLPMLHKGTKEHLAAWQNRHTGSPSINASTLVSVITAVAFHCCFGLFLASFLKAMMTDPGGVPQHWGFYVGDEARRRRYCRVCNVWKPNRAHHCSHCCRCILNMDHHCPWINNCVGFYNRKFFVQTLMYGNASLIFVFIHGILHVASAAKEYWPLGSYDPVYYETSPTDFVDWALTIVLIATAAVMLAGLIPFSRFHWHLLIINSTTIESMDPSFHDHAAYDLGTRRNIEQVFGPSMWLWWLPIHMDRSRPVGDGVRWRRHYLRVPQAASGFDQ